MKHWGMLFLIGLAGPTVAADKKPWEKDWTAVVINSSEPDSPDSHQFPDAWQMVTFSQSGTVWYVKGRDLRNGSGPTRTVWVKQDHRRDKLVTARESKVQFRVSCKARTYALLAFIDYNADGAVLRDASVPSYQARDQPIAPDTVAEDFAASVCGGDW